MYKIYKKPQKGRRSSDSRSSAHAWCAQLCLSAVPHEKELGLLRPEWRIPGVGQCRVTRCDSNILSF